jgi:hypothetical protein
MVVEHPPLVALAAVELVLVADLMELLELLILVQAAVAGLLEEALQVALVAQELLLLDI